MEPSRLEEIRDAFARLGDLRMFPIVYTYCSELLQYAHDLEEVHTDHQRLVRELDVLINGPEGAAPQASLCDIVGQLQATKQKLASQLVVTKELPFRLQSTADVVQMMAALDVPDDGWMMQELAPAHHRIVVPDDFVLAVTDAVGKLRQAGHRIDVIAGRPI